MQNNVLQRFAGKISANQPFVQLENSPQNTISGIAGYKIYRSAKAIFLVYIPQTLTRKS
jgi:hypothetical protein